MPRVNVYGNFIPERINSMSEQKKEAIKVFYHTRRVVNGWIVDMSNRDYGSGGTEYVFRTPEELAAFVRQYAKGQEKLPEEK
jgi:hypothetical protein